MPFLNKSRAFDVDDYGYGAGTGDDAGAAAECGLVRTVDGLGERAPVPLKSVNISVDIMDFVAEITVKQQYVNLEDGPIEAAYLFPVEEESAVVHFEAEVDGRRIQAKLKEKEQAKKDYSKAVEENRTAFLLEETKADVFNIMVGHLKPKAVATIVLRYVSELPVEPMGENGGTAVRLTIPTTIGPRYTPPEHYATDEAAKKIADIKYQTDTPAPLSIKLKARATTDILAVTSPSHKLVILNIVDKVCRGTLKGTVTEMDRDFIALVRAENMNKPRTLLEEWSEKGTLAAMVSLVPSFKLREQPVEVVFLVDRSGSMEGSSIAQAKKALQLFLHSLPPGCRFNIVSYGSNFDSLFKESFVYDDDTLAKAKEHVTSMTANYGGTLILSPLQKILQDPPRDGFLRQVFVLTDGDVSNDDQVMSMVKEANADRDTRVFTLGLGNSCSRHLVKGIARAGGGTAEFASENEDLSKKLMAMLKHALQPAIKDVKVEWLGGRVSERDKLTQITRKEDLLLGQAPSNLPPIYDGSRLLVYRLFSNKENPTGVRITASTPDGKLKVEEGLYVRSTAGKSSTVVHQLAARKRVQDLEEAKTDLAASKAGSKEPDKVPTIDDISTDEDLWEGGGAGLEEVDKKHPTRYSRLGVESGKKLSPTDKLKTKFMVQDRERKAQMEEAKWRSKQEKLNRLLKEREASKAVEASREGWLREALVELGTTYHLATSATSFVAVDPRDPEGTFAPMVRRDVPNQIAKGYGKCRLLECDGAMINLVDSEEDAPDFEDMTAPGDDEGAAAPSDYAYMAASPGKIVLRESSRSEDDAPDFEDVTGPGDDEGLGQAKAADVPAPKQEEDGIEKCLNDVISLQGASGLFKWGTALEKALGCSKVEAMKKKPTSVKEEDEWSTLLALAWLESECGDKKDLWELVATKAEKALQKGTSAADKKAAKATVALFKAEAALKRGGADGAKKGCWKGAGKFFARCCSTKKKK